MRSWILMIFLAENVEKPVKQTARPTGFFPVSAKNIKAPG
jgi:hypothetical protein